MLPVALITPVGATINQPTLTQSAGVSAETTFTIYSTRDDVSRSSHITEKISLPSSVRFFNLLSASTLLALTSISLLSFFSRSRLTPALLPFFLLYQLKKPRHDSFSLQGTIIDRETLHPLSGVNIYVFEDNSKRIISHAVSNHSGRISLPHLIEGRYNLSVLKRGYLPFTIHKHLTKEDTEFYVGLTRKELPRAVGLRLIGSLEDFFNFSFEAWLLLSFILLTLVGMSIGWEKIIGFLAIALFNLTIWFMHRKTMIDKS